MNDITWMLTRHSVRNYDSQPLAADVREELQERINTVNRESSQHFQLLVGEPRAFTGMLARYGSFSGVVNYIAVVGDDEVKLGYYGEELVHACTDLGLKTCWVCLTFRREKSLIDIPAGCKLYGVIAVGTSRKTGVPHKMRTMEELTSDDTEKPDWFAAGMKGVALAPSALNQQKYRFFLRNGKPAARQGSGFYTGLDLGIAEYHFDQASGTDWFRP